MFRAVCLMVISTCHARKIVHAGCMSVVYVRVLNIKLWPRFSYPFTRYRLVGSIFYIVLSVRFSQCPTVFAISHRCWWDRKKGACQFACYKKDVCIYFTWASATIFRVELIARPLYVYLPANRYMKPVTNTALICRWHTPKAPIKAALPSMIRHTNEHEIDKFCIPGCCVGWQNRESYRLDQVDLGCDNESKSVRRNKKVTSTSARVEAVVKWNHIVRV